MLRYSKQSLLTVQVVEVCTAKANCFTNLALISQKESNITECFSWCEKALA